MDLPNPKRLSLSDRAPSLLAVTASFSSTPRLAIMRGIHSVCHERDWLLHRAQPSVMADAAREYRPDAVIVVLEDARDIPARPLRGQFVVSAGNDLISRGWPSVAPDNWEIGRRAARHLLERGLRNLAAFGIWRDATGKISHPWATKRLQGLVEAAREAGIAVNQFNGWIMPALGKPRDGGVRLEQIQQWLTELPRPCGVMTPCDGWGQVLSAVCREMQLNVPEEIAIVSVDDSAELCETCDPPLSSVAIPWERIGRLTAEMAGVAIAAGQRSAPRLVLVPSTSVTVRRSSDSVAVDDPDVAAALTIILAHPDRPITVREIMRQVPTTQRRLEQHFKRIVGRRMVEEIRRVHIEHAKRLLAESDLSIPAIARQCGFSCAPRLSAAFRRETGTTPSRFRRSLRAGV